MLLLVAFANTPSASPEHITSIPEPFHTHAEEQLRARTMDRLNSRASVVSATLPLPSYLQAPTAAKLSTRQLEVR